MGKNQITYVGTINKGESIFQAAWTLAPPGSAWSTRRAWPASTSSSQVGPSVSPEESPGTTLSDRLLEVGLSFSLCKSHGL